MILADFAIIVLLILVAVTLAVITIVAIAVITRRAAAFNAVIETKVIALNANHHAREHANKLLIEEGYTPVGEDALARLSFSKMAFSTDPQIMLFFGIRAKLGKLNEKTLDTVEAQ